jgi:hypothetical protein
MAVAQDDSWTTWISILGASIQMWILLIICLVFKARAARRARRNALEATLSIEQNLLDPKTMADGIQGGFDRPEAEHRR